MDDEHEKKAEKNTYIKYGIFAVLAAVVLIAGYTYFTDGDTPEAEQRVSQVLENPDEYAGEKITLAGNVASVFGSRALTIDAPDPFSDELLIISREPLEPIGGSGPEDYLFAENDRISINGEIRSFDIREFEDELGTDLVDEEFVEWEGRPAVIADSVNFDR